MDGEYLHARNPIRKSPVKLPDIVKGMRILPVRKPFLGRLRANLVLAFVNALSNAKITRGESDEVFITSNGFVFQIKRAASDGGGGVTILLQTNGVDNADQELLNLVAGDNITLVNTGGNVEISSTASSGGYRGNYAPDTVYNSGDIVRSDDGVFGCVMDETEGITPVEGANWHLLAYPPASFSICVAGEEKDVIYNGLPPA